MDNLHPILITGATGYVGGRLAVRLMESGATVRCLVRDPERLKLQPQSTLQVVQGDVTQPETLSSALQDVHTAFYLVHAMASTGDFVAMEQQGAQHFADAARNAGVKRIIYLGGLGNSSDNHSEHMHSRHQVGDILRASGIQVIELQASIIIGSGSLSFELIRSLVTRLPIMIVPKWVRVEAQPISIEDVLKYLISAIELIEEESVIYEIAGPNRLSYLDLMKWYSSIVGLRRVYIKVPFLTPWLSSLWLNLVTPLFARVGRKLIDSICIPSIVEDEQSLRDFDIKPMGIDEAIQFALQEEEQEVFRTHWSDALSSTGNSAPYGGQYIDSKIVDSRTIMVNAPQETVFSCVECIGGKQGWYYGNSLWKIRGFLDRLMGGVGMQRGRRHPTELFTGDVVDCWRVEVIEPGERLLLRAEMKVFGKAWLQFEVTPNDTQCELRQTALYQPKGLFGYIYWYSLYPLHELIFHGMLRNIGKAAETKSSGR